MGWFVVLDLTKSGRLPENGRKKREMIDEIKKKVSSAEPDQLCLSHWFCRPWGWSGSAMVLGKHPVPGRPTIWSTSRPVAKAYSVILKLVSIRRRDYFCLFIFVKNRYHFRHFKSNCSTYCWQNGQI